jgi:large subunit ribosomal protein L2
MKFLRKGFQLAVASSPGQRHKLRLIQKSSFIDNLNPTVKHTFKRLQHGVTYNAGRNNHGRITVRGLGGGNTTNYRILDLKRLTTSIGIVISISYDPNRNANIASILYNQLDSSAITYQIATHGLVLGQIVQSGSDAPHVLGNTLPIANINVGTVICLIETQFNKGATLCRSAGSSARLIKKDLSTGYAIIRLKSGIFKSIPLDCKATIGIVSNIDYRHQYLGKAGVSR